MRSLYAAVLTLVVSITAGAQGRLIPRPCPQPVPPPCREGRCPEVLPIRPCIANNAIIRTSSQVRVEMVNRVLRYEVNELIQDVRAQFRHKDEPAADGTDEVEDLVEALAIDFEAELALLETPAAAAPQTPAAKAGP